MCIIAYKPAGVRISEERLKACFDNNPDGAGFSVVKDGVLTTKRGIFTYSGFREEYDPYANDQALLHFRIRTHGDYSGDNCHPHEITSHLVFAHNGIISEMPYHETKSDTVLFNELVLQNLVRIYGKKIVFDKVVQVLLAKYIGSSRLCFMGSNGKVTILPHKAGEWSDDVWYSNYSFRPRPKYTPPALPSPTSSVGGQTDNKGIADTATTPANSAKIIVMEDWVRLRYRWNVMEIGSLGKVKGFYQNGEVEVYFPIKKLTIRMPSAYLDKVLPVRVAPPSDGGTTQ